MTEAIVEEDEEEPQDETIATEDIDAANETQSTFVIFGKLSPKRPIFGFRAIILEPNQVKNQNFSIS